MKPVTFEASATIDREAFDDLRAFFRGAYQSVQPLVVVGAEGCCPILARLLGSRVDRLDVAIPDCSAIGGRCPSTRPRCRQCGIEIDPDAIARRQTLGRSLGLPLPAPAICVDCAIENSEREDGAT
jgi:hypothetical protein